MSQHLNLSSAVRLLIRISFTPKEAIEYLITPSKEVQEEILKTVQSRVKGRM